MTSWLVHRALLFDSIRLEPTIVPKRDKPGIHITDQHVSKIDFGKMHLPDSDSTTLALYAGSGSSTVLIVSDLCLVDAGGVSSTSTASPFTRAHR